MISSVISAIDNPDDQQFMIALYNEYEQLMFWAVSKYLVNIEDRRDAVQDTLVTLIRKIDTIRSLEENRLRTYIVYTAESKAINLVKRKNIELRLFDDLDSIPTGASINSAEEYFLQIGIKNKISSIWPKLTTQEKIVLESKYILGYNNNEIGKILGCRANSVRMYLTRARRKALDLLMEVGEFEPL